jgi:hypothetical protein
LLVKFNLLNFGISHFGLEILYSLVTPFCDVYSAQLSYLPAIVPSSPTISSGARKSQDDESAGLCTGEYHLRSGVKTVQKETQEKRTRIIYESNLKKWNWIYTSHLRKHVNFKTMCCKLLNEYKV